MDAPSLAHARELVLLTTKIRIPAIRPDLVSRPRLVERLRAAIRRKLTLISAPAGFGKTTLAVAWLRDEDRPTAWLSLDDGDNDPLRFWRYVVAAVQTVYPALGEAVLAALQSSHPPDLEPLLAALLNELAAAPDPFTLVLDDYHAIEAATIHSSLDFFLDHSPSNLDVVIVTRSDPPLSLSRRRGRAELAEIRTADLSFTREEATALLNAVAGLELSPDEITTLARRTEGWIVGLQMAAIALRSLAPDPGAAKNRQDFVAAFAGDDRYIFDYLMEEVLERQPPHVRDFLLQTSILDRLCGPLCDAVTGRTDSQEILRDLERANLFTIPLDNRRRWYRYHHLFADLLRRSLPPGGKRGGDEGEAHLRACQWYETEGLFDEAISHALAIPDSARAASLIERHGLNLLFHGQVLPVQGWFQVLPPDLIHSRPLLCVISAWSEFLASWSWYTGDVKPLVEPWLVAAEKALAETAASPGGSTVTDSDNVKGHVAALRALVSFYRHDEIPTIIALSQQALDRLSENDLGLRSTLLQNLGYLYGDAHVDAANQAFAQAKELWDAGGRFQAPFTAVHEHAWVAAWRGRLHESAAICREALTIVTDPSPIAGLIYNELGGVLLEWGDLDQAEQVLLRARKLLKLAEWPDRQARLYANLVRLRQVQGDLARALHLVDEMERLSPDAEWHTSALRARLWLAHAEHAPHYLDRAESWAESCGVTLDEDRFHHPATTTLVRLHIARRRASAGSAPDLKSALVFLERYLRYAQKWQATGQAIEALTLRALALEASGDVAQGLLSLERALALGEPEGYVFPFVQAGAPGARLLRQVTPETDYVRRVLAAFPAAAAETVAEPLSPREREVLSLIATGASNPEIARQLFISVNTVKRHCTHIFRKLGVSNRTQASARARDLGVTPPGLDKSHP